MANSSTEREPRWRRGRRTTWLAVCLIVITIVVVANVLANSSGDRSNSRKSALSYACQKVAAALSDGPDPTADPVGYAEAQVRPLRDIATSDVSLRRAIEALSSAYEESFQDDANKSSLQTVSGALRKVESFCPRVSS